MSEKQNITAMLISIGFPESYIQRAFNVYEKNYGHSYNIEVITEIIIRLQKKDKNKPIHSVPPQQTDKQTYNRSQLPNMIPFQQHLTLTEANQLHIHDKIDHRDQVGRFVYGTIVEKHGTNLKIHYDGWSRKWDTWSDYSRELHRFARAGSISKRPAHRFFRLKKGDYVDINPTQRHVGWRTGEIRRLDKKSGQVQVVYDQLDKNYLYWAHLDNDEEIAEFTERSGIPEPSSSRQIEFPQDPLEEINNPYSIGDQLCVNIKHDWLDALVIDKENNWIVLRINFFDFERDEKYHIIRHATRLNDTWYNELAFEVLRDNSLVKCYNEWKSVKKNFGTDTDAALKWLEIQKQPFRVSRLSHVLLCGFAPKVNIPMDVQRIIISFCNFMFIKVRYSANDVQCKYRALDTNITICNLAKMFEIYVEKFDPTSHFAQTNERIHIFSRFGSIKDVYIVETDKMKVTLHDLKHENDNRWVEIPDDYAGLLLGSLDRSMKYDEVLEIGVDIVSMNTSSFTPKNKMYNHMSTSEWIFSLQIGDIIDVYNNNAKRWCSAMIRYISETSFYIHYIGYVDKCDEIIEVTNILHLSRLQERYSQSWYSRKIESKKKQVNDLIFCWRTESE